MQLNNPDYMKIVLDGKENLEELFASMGQSLIEEYKGMLTDIDRILPGLRSLAGLPSLPDKLLNRLQGSRIWLNPTGFCYKGFFYITSYSRTVHRSRLKV